MVQSIASGRCYVARADCCRDGGGGFCFGWTWIGGCYQSDVNEIVWRGGVDWIGRLRDVGKWWDFVNTVMNNRGY
jgi:hypothetical protein